MCIPSMAWAVSQVFLKCTQRFEPLIYTILWGFLSQVNSDLFLEVTSGLLLEKKGICVVFKALNFWSFVSVVTRKQVLRLNTLKKV